MDVEQGQQTSPGPSPRSGLRTFHTRRTLIAAAAAAVLIAGALLIRPAERDGPRPVQPGERAMTAVGAGSPATVEDLTALISDREKWLRKYPRDDRSWAVLGSAYLEWGRRTADSAYFPQAEQALKRSLKEKPKEKGNFEAMVGMGALANARHDFATARKWGELVRAQAPGRWTAYPVLVDAYSGLGQYKAAEKAAGKLAALRPGTVAYTSMSKVYRDMGWREDAAAALERASAAARTPAEKADCLYRLGELSWERGEPEEALRHFEGALRSDGEHHQALGGRARTLAALDRSGEAVKDYRTALRRAPVPRYALELGELLESLGRTEEAKVPYDLLQAQIARAAAHGVNGNLVLGLFEADHGDPASAVRRLSVEWTRHKSVQVADAVGWALHRTGQNERALVFAKKATDLGLRSADFAYHRGQIERALGRPGPARRHLEEALRTNPQFSPLRAPLAREALTALGEPPPGGPPPTRLGGAQTGAGQPSRSPSQQPQHQQSRPPQRSGPQAQPPVQGLGQGAVQGLGQGAVQGAGPSSLHSAPPGMPAGPQLPSAGQPPGN
ncbi:tetratricopeptide repeat protein [Streptomyces sp. NPDC051219]|uniref:tetratricopeptide repeat protein n=1 Tax=Streptomyces sp. NPDC051219 TaxID=3155283 RepID=UPI00342045AF